MIAGWLLIAGCGPDLRACDAWITCASAISEQDGVEAAARYEAGGSCFASASSDDCVAACEDELIRQWTFHRDERPECDPNAIGLGADLDVTAFTEAYGDLVCSWWVTCRGECSLGLDGLSCTGFDPALGEACIEGEWSCDGDAPGFFPGAPRACQAACKVFSSSGAYGAE